MVERVEFTQAQGNALGDPMQLRNSLYYLRDYRLWMVVGLVCAVSVAYYGELQARQIATWMAMGLVLVLVAALVVWLVRRLLAWRAARKVEAMLRDNADRAVDAAPADQRADTEALRTRMREAVKQIKSSRLGVMKGNAALYELPWYVVIGNPAAGKTTAVVNSGLQFPFQDSTHSAVQGLGGTRNCDWYFSSGGIVIDTAGRYSVNAVDRLEWLTFLGLLKKSRPRAPINGIVVAASIAEVANSSEAFTVTLATTLRQRLQEITENLEVQAPVYVLFTKADLMAGFAEFFSTITADQRDQVWGATLPYIEGEATSVVDAFDREFDTLADGLKALSLTQLAQQRGGTISPGLLSLPLEFLGVQPSLRRFIATLFEDNPYQFRPVFRGFYFSSALQDGYSVQQASERIGQRFMLTGKRVDEDTPVGHTAYFLKDFFAKVVFGDHGLVRRYASPRHDRLRLAVFITAAVVLAVLLAGWSWSYTSNAQLVRNAEKDLAQAVQIQQGRIDLKSRMEALLLLQDRMEQLDRVGAEGSIGRGLGLYQGNAIRHKLLDEYVRGLRQVMLEPTVASLERYLGEVVADRTQLGSTSARPVEVATLYQDASPTSTDDAYNALKTYLMLGDAEHREPAHLEQQLTLFWRGWLEANRGQMSREEMVRSAERVMRFYVSETDVAALPGVRPNAALVADVRQTLSQVMKGRPALERVLGQIKARAAARFPTITVDALIGAELNNQLISSSYAVSGAFSRAAWEGYVQSAIEQAASAQLSTTDWVLGMVEQDDLSLAGSPEHVARELTTLYKQAYATEWTTFIGGLGMGHFRSFDAAVSGINHLGDTAVSPLRLLLQKINEQTVWDNPQALATTQASESGVIAWFKRVILRRASAPDGMEPAGPVGSAFVGIARLTVPRDSQPAIIDVYFDQLSKLRARLNAIRSLRDIGSGAATLMKATIDNKDSELSSALAVVDGQVLNGLNDTQRDALRPLLLRPLTETFSALVVPVEAELNREWTARVYQPYNETIAQQFPFRLNADVDASPANVAQIFGASGAIAAFNREVLQSLVIQRGTLLQPRRWADIGIELSSGLISNYGTWVSANSTAAAASTVFEIRPVPGVGASGYTVEIDGQTLRYPETASTWTTMQYPNPEHAPGAQITAVALDGRTVPVFSASGADAFARLMREAQNQRIDGANRLTWRAGSVSVSVDMRVISRPDSTGTKRDWQRGLRLPVTIAGTPRPLDQPVGADAGAGARAGTGAETDARSGAAGGIP